MSQHIHSHGQAFPNHQLPNPQRSTYSNDIGHLPTSYPTSQSPLPPLSTATTTIMNDPLSSSRLQQSQPSVFHSQPYPVYAPTAYTHLQHELPASSQSPAYTQPAPSHYFTTADGQRPSYTTAAPPNLQLPKIQPAPMTNDDLKHFSRESLHSLAAAPPQPEQETTPKHVVGSQGRRGILPSASGRPQATTNQNMSNGKNSPALAKDLEGKYPCPHCSKPYLHAKHLKRHMLRHTGVRPYECALCNDTFSRSDILKRHFAKCSQRRGNPTGQNHLDFSRANKKAKQQESEQQQQQQLQQQQQQAASFDAMTTEQMSLPIYTTSLGSPLGIAALDLGPNFDNRQEPLNHVTRTNELKKANGIGPVSNRGSTSSMTTFENAAFSTGHVTPDSVSTSGAATPYTYPHERSSLSSPADAGFDHLNLSLGGSRLSGSGYTNGHLPNIVGQPNERGHSYDWSQFQPPYSNDEFPPYQSGSNTPHHNTFKQEDDFSNFEWAPHPK